MRGQRRAASTFAPRQKLGCHASLQAPSQVSQCFLLRGGAGKSPKPFFYPRKDHLRPHLYPLSSHHFLTPDAGQTKPYSPSLAEKCSRLKCFLPGFRTPPPSQLLMKLLCIVVSLISFVSWADFNWSAFSVVFQLIRKDN